MTNLNRETDRIRESANRHRARHRHGKMRHLPHRQTSVNSPRRQHRIIRSGGIVTSRHRNIATCRGPAPRLASPGMTARDTFHHRARRRAAIRLRATEIRSRATHRARRKRLIPHVTLSVRTAARAAPSCRTRSAVLSCASMKTPRGVSMKLSVSSAADLSRTRHQAGIVIPTRQLAAIDGVPR